MFSVLLGRETVVEPEALYMFTSADVDPALLTASPQLTLSPLKDPGKF